MVAVSTFPNGTDGYALFIDGRQVGQGLLVLPMLWGRARRASSSQQDIAMQQHLRASTPPRAITRSPRWAPARAWSAAASRT